MNASELFILPESLKTFEKFFDENASVWTWIPKIKEALDSLDLSTFESKKDIPALVSVGKNVFIHPTVKLPPFAVICDNVWIGANTQIRPSAYIREYSIIGENCTIGNSCEIKNSLILNNAEVPHFNYVGDSILGNYAHMGAGAICANLKLDKTTVFASTPNGRVNTNLRKLGAILGDKAQCGCNAVLQPGTILGKGSVVLSTLAFSGFLANDTFYIEKPENPRKIKLKC